ncbi:MAG TPA: PrsW family intramembrane metalloprotease [Candidatus Dormibacteraeota bacterium]
MTTAANPRLERAPHYRLAVGLAAALVVCLFISSAVTSLVLGTIPSRISLFGLPVIALVALATWIGVRAFDRDPAERRRHLLRAAVILGIALLLWLLVVDLFLFTGDAPLVALISALACLPTTAFGIFVVRLLDRNEKEPWRLVMVAVAWGAVVATALVIWANTSVGEIAATSLVPGPGLDAFTAYGAGFFEEIAKGLAVLLLYLVMRDEFDDVVDGILYGACVGLGFNYMESILYMTHLYAIFADEGIGGFAAGFQWYFRQVVGLFFGHATYTALVGAGLGVARQLPRLHQRVLAIAGGWLVAISAHFAWDAWIQLFTVGDGALALIGAHLRTLMMDGPFTAAVLLLLAMGLGVEGRALRRQLELEAASGSGAVAPGEVGVLTSPWRRWHARMQVLTLSGLRAYRRLGRLQQAQLDLAMEQWHRERRELGAPLDAEDRLRRQILALKS